MAARLTATAPNGGMTFQMHGKSSSISHPDNGLKTPSSPTKKHKSTPSKSSSSTSAPAAAKPMENLTAEVEVILVNLKEGVQPHSIRRPNSVGLASEADMGVIFARNGTRIVFHHHGADKIVYLVEGETGWDEGILSKGKKNELTM